MKFSLKMKQFYLYTWRYHQYMWRCYYSIGPNNISCTHTCVEFLTVTVVYGTKSSFRVLESTLHVEVSPWCITFSSIQGGTSLQMSLLCNSTWENCLFVWRNYYVWYWYVTLLFVLSFFSLSKLVESRWYCQSLAEDWWFMFKYLRKPVRWRLAAEIWTKSWFQCPRKSPIPYKQTNHWQPMFYFIFPFFKIFILEFTRML